MIENEIYVRARKCALYAMVRKCYNNGLLMDEMLKKVMRLCEASIYHKHLFHISAATFYYYSIHYVHYNVLLHVRATENFAAICLEADKSIKISETQDTPRTISLRLINFFFNFNNLN